jgi:hypothetical protein
MSFELRYIFPCFFSLLIVLGVVCAASNEDDATGERRKTFQAAFITRVESLQDSNLATLRQALYEEVDGDIPLNKLITNVEYEVTEGRIRDILETRLGPTGDGTISPEKSVDYWRKITAAKQLLESSSETILGWLVSRKEQGTPMLSDAVVAFAVLDNGKLGSSTATKQNEWQKLFNGNNPFGRLLAVRSMDEWADQDDFPSLLRDALSDEYWYIRYQALKIAERNSSAQVEREIDRFLKADMDQGLTLEMRRKEETLRRMAKEIIDKTSTR